LPTGLVSRALRDWPQVQSGADVEAAVLFVDIPGFGQLAERMSADGLAGAEKLGQFLNSLFGSVIERIEAYGGEIVALPGDAVSAMWSAEEADIQSCVRRAAAAALDIQNLAGADRADVLARLRFHVAVGCGRIWIGTVGADGAQRLVCATGGAMVDTARTAAEASPGAVAVTTPAAARLQGSGVVSLDGQRHRLSRMTLAEVPAARERQPLGLDEVRPFLSPALVEWLQAGHDDWLAEFRRTSVAFVGLGGAASAEAFRRDPEQLRQAISLVQTEVARFQGTVNQVACDDKGLSVLGAWGLRGASGEHSAVRAAGAASAIRAGLRALGVDGTVGVATGPCFCGPRGSPTRREYAIVGNCVVTAARLMQLAGEGGVLLDEATVAAAGGRLSGVVPRAVLLKGRADPITAYEPASPDGRGQTGKDDEAPGRPTIVGRASELAAVARALDRLADPARGAPRVLVEGEAGIGKSTFLAACRRLGEDRGLLVLAGAGDAVDRLVPYLAWRSVLRGLLGSGAVAAAEARRHLSGPGEADRLPLLGELLDVELPDNDRTRHLAGAARVEATADLAVRLIQRALRGRRALLLVDDAQWLDSASWATLRRAAGALPEAAILVATRPPNLDDLPREARDIFKLADRLELVLGPLTAEDLDKLIATTLAAEDVAPQATEVIRRRAGGNPLFTQQLALALRDCGFVTVSGRRCRVSSAQLNLSNVGLPGTVDEIVGRRLEELPASPVLTLKVASVLGSGFDLGSLSSVYPLPHDPKGLRHDVDLLVARQLLTREASAFGADRYSFTHALTHDAVYARLPYAQRRDLHGRVARWIERVAPSEEGLLAHHWYHADDASKACLHAARAGEHALRIGANREAAELYARALELLEQHRGELGQRVRQSVEADWLCRLGVARYGLGELARARDHLQASIDFFRRRHRPARSRWAAILVRELGAQIGLRLLDGETLPDPDAADGLATVAMAAQRLSETYLWARENVPMLACTLLSVNAAERARRIAGTARSYAMLAFSLGVCGMHGLARWYFSRALAVAEQHRDLPGRVFVGYSRGVYLIGVGRWGESRKAAEQGAAAARELGDPQESEMIEAALGNLEYYTGDLAASGARYRALWQAARQRGNAQHEAWGLYGEARSLMLQGEFARAEERLRKALSIFAENPEEVSELICHGLLAECRLDQGDLEQATRHARAAMQLIRRAPPTVVTALQGYAAVARVALARLSASPARAASEPVYQEAIHAVRQLRRYALFFPIGRPRARLMSACLLSLLGHPRRAQRRFHGALSLAQRLGLPYEEALIHAHLGAAAASDSRERASHLAQMHGLIARMNAAVPPTAI